jgi:hypothetical protein
LPVLKNNLIVSGKTGLWFFPKRNKPCVVMIPVNRYLAILVTIVSPGHTPLHVLTERILARQKDSFQRASINAAQVCKQIAGYSPVGV